MLAGPRYLFALARDGYGPSLLGGVHPRFRTPAAAVVLQTAIALPLALSGTFVELAAVSVMARLATYVGTAAAVPVLRRKLEPQEIFSQIIQHKWLLSEQSGRDIGMAPAVQA